MKVQVLAIVGSNFVKLNSLNKTYIFSLLIVGRIKKAINRIWVSNVIDVLLLFLFATVEQLFKVQILFQSH